MKHTMRWALLVGLIFVFAGCSALEGDKGDPGDPGVDGINGDDAPYTALETCPVCHGPDRAVDLNVMHGIEVPDADPALPHVATFLTAAPNTPVLAAGVGASKVSFTVKDQDGNPVTGLTKSSFRFTVARLEPGAATGDSSAWQSLIFNAAVAPGTGAVTGATAKDQATYENGSSQTGNGLVESGTTPGSYTYTFGKDLNAQVTLDATRTHRIGMQTTGSAITLATNPTVDFVPDGVTTLATRNIVATETCNSCHNNLALHGGSRKETKYCVTCHNPGTADPETGNTVDFKVMIHKIHMGKNLPSVIAGGSYTIVGYNGSVHDYSELGFPQPVNTCAKCHDNTVAGNTDTDNWKSVANIETCGACHDDIVFSSATLATGQVAHPGGVPVTNAECATCHGATKIADVAVKHVIPALEAGKNFQYAINTVTGTAPGEFPVVNFTISNPVASTNYVLNGASPDTAWGQTSSGASRLAVIVGWDTKDYNNTGSGNKAAQPVSINALTAAVAGTDGSYTVTSTVAIPADATGTGVVGIEGHPAVDDGTGAIALRVPVKSVVKYFGITDATPVDRRKAVDVTAKCDNCHGTLSMHGSNRTNEGQVCVICHNPNATDITKRPDDHTATATLTADGKKEESIDFKRMIHGIHGAAKRENPLVVYGYGNTEHVFDETEVHFPGILNNCQNCHVAGAYELPLAKGVLGSTIDSDPVAATKADTIDSALLDPTDDHNISPTAAVCSACHDTKLATVHMQQNGAGFSVLQEDIVDIQ